MVAKLDLDASEYVSEINAIGAKSDAAFKGVAAAGKQAEAAVDGVGKQAKSTADRIENSFGHVRSFERLIGAFALLRMGMGVAEGIFDAADAASKESAAAIKGDFLGVVQAQRDMLDAEEKSIRGIPLLGGVFAAGNKEEKKAFEEEIKDIESVEKATQRMEQQSVKLHEEAVLEKMKLDGASDSDILAKKLAFQEDSRKTELEKDEKDVETAAKLAAAAQENLRKHQVNLAAAGEEGSDAYPFLAEEVEKLKQEVDAAQNLYAAAAKAYAHDKASIAEIAANDQREVAQKESEDREKEEKRINDEAVKEQESAAKRAEAAERKREEDEKKYNRDQALSNKQDKERLAERAKSYASHPEAAQMASGEDYAPPYVPDTDTRMQQDAATLAYLMGGTPQFPAGSNTPARQSSSGSRGTVINAPITINPPPNLDPAQIAKMIVPELERLFRLGRLSLVGN